MPGDITAGPGVSILIDALQHHSVSVASDEPLLILNLLSLDVSKILQSPIELRMPTVWSQLWSVTGGIPQNILFHSGPKLVTNGYRWAPATLLIPTKKSKTGHYLTALVDEASAKSLLPLRFDCMKRCC